MEDKYNKCIYLADNCNSFSHDFLGEFKEFTLQAVFYSKK